MELFDFVDTLFGRPAVYAELKDHEKQRHFFMVNRFMSMQHPLPAGAFNHIRIPQARVMDFWQAQMSSSYTRTPKWMYTKTKKSDKPAEKKSKLPSDEAVSQYLMRTGFTRRHLSDAVATFGDSAYDPIRRLEKMIADASK